jgi:hypothetical protein
VEYIFYVCECHLNHSYAYGYTIHVIQITKIQSLYCSLSRKSFLWLRIRMRGGSGGRKRVITKQTGRMYALIGLMFSIPLCINIINNII